MYKIKTIFLKTLLLSVILTGSFFTETSYAVTVAECSALNAATAPADKKQACLTLLSSIDQQILEQQRLVDSKKGERQSHERDVAIAEAEIKKSQLAIQARSISIRNLGSQIDDKEKVVGELDDRLGKQKQSVAALIRKTQEIDDNSLVELLLSNQNFSEFFADFEDYRTINNSLRESLQVLTDIKVDNIEQKRSLEDRQQEEARQRQLQENEKSVLEVKEAEKRRILEVTKGQEAAYQATLEQTQKTAAQLRAALFELAGGSGRIPFPEAVRLAKVSGSATGVAPALILAILEQESSFGANIGQCTYDQMIQGKPAMGPGSVPVFTVMAGILNFDIKTQAVSCPITPGGVRYGWGGAMGPSQFIPSTWAFYGGYVNTGNDIYEYQASKDVIRQVLGLSVPSNPFRNQDAFTATALLMRDNGAGGRTAQTERLAAIRYYAGWAGANNPANHSYGDQVMKRKDRLEAEIRTLEGS